jgi:hypothetical protein
LSRDRIIERERRWALPAAIASLLALVLVVIGVILGAGIPQEDHTAEQLRAYDDHAAALTVSSIVTGVAFALLAAPLLYLFRAAQARNPRVQALLVAFCFIGPVLICAQGVVRGLAYPDVASDFVASADQEQTRDLSRFRGQVEHDPTSIEKVTFHTDSDTLEVEQTGGEFYSSEYPPAAEDQLLKQVDDAGIDNEDDSDGEVGDAFAESQLDDSGSVSAATSLLFPALLGMVIVMVYLPLQALRAGLLTRFFGTLGMALGVSLIILPQAQLLIALWFGYLGLLFVGRVPGGRPPSWDAGEAIPWPRPGDEKDAPRQASDAIEGSATEVEAAEGDSEAGGGQAGRGDQAGSAKRKRKRRR